MTTEAENTDGVTIVPGEVAMTASVSTEQVKEEAPAELLAGKFKTPADLEAGYNELQKLLGDKAAAPVVPVVAETPEADATPEATATSPYGKAVSDAMTAAEIKVEDAEAEFANDGKFSEDTISKFEKAGFPREMVEAYARGLTANVTDAKVLGEAQITSVKAAAGGDEGFAKLTAWMAGSVDQATLDVYNADVSSGDVTKATAAVAAMAAKHQAEVGTEGVIVGGKAPANAVEGYTSEAEYLQDVRNPEYKKNAAFREKTDAKLAASPAVFTTR